MSGFLKSIGKAFKRIVKSPIFKAVAIGAAIYFTGGLALGALGGAVLPGVGALASTLGITAGSFGAAAAGAVGISAASISAGVLTGAADLAAGGLATAGIGSTIASTAASAAGAAGLLTGAADLAAGAAPIAEVAASTAGTSGLSALTTGAKSFFGSTFGQKIMGQAIEFGGKAILGAMDKKTDQERYEQSREDAIRRGAVPDITNQYETPKALSRPGELGTPVQIGGGIGGGGAGSYRTGYRTPGIVNSALQEDPLKQPQGA